MTLLDDAEILFGTRSLYDIIGANPEASDQEIKKAYRKTSLKIHPDRVQESDKDKATRKFQVLAQVHFILTDSERRKLYDEQGIIANEDSLEGEADWSAYWRLLFPKITGKDIKNYLSSYIGSDEEEADLIKLYNRFEGDLDKINETHISYDEDKTVAQLKDLIKKGKIKDFTKFSKESDSKRNKRKKRAEREAKQAEEVPSDDLIAMIKNRASNFDSMIANLEAKYVTKKRKR